MTPKCAEDDTESASRPGGLREAIKYQLRNALGLNRTHLAGLTGLTEQDALGWITRHGLSSQLLKFQVSRRAKVTCPLLEAYFTYVVWVLMLFSAF